MVGGGKKCQQKKKNCGNIKEGMTEVRERKKNFRLVKKKGVRNKKRRLWG